MLHIQNNWTCFETGQIRPPPPSPLNANLYCEPDYCIKMSEGHVHKNNRCCTRTIMSTDRQHNRITKRLQLFKKG